MMHRAAIAARSLAHRRNACAVTRTTFVSRMTKTFSTTSIVASGDGVEIPAPPTSNHAHTKLPNAQASIIYTETDEAPALATYSLYPVVNKIGALADIDIIPCDISVSGRVLALFPEKLNPDQRVPDNLAYLGEIAKTPEANIIKLPNSKYRFELYLFLEACPIGLNRIFKIVVVCYFRRVSTMRTHLISIIVLPFRIDFGILPLQQ